MNYFLIARLLGTLLIYEAMLMLPSLIVSNIYGGEDAWCFYLTIAILLVVGTLLSRINKNIKGEFRSKEGFATVGLAWIVLALAGALPFYFSGYFNSYIDCFFEAVSGFTTTGSTILANVELVPKGLLFWRSFTHWIGGMGVLVFMLAIMPSANASELILFKAESPGPEPGKFLPKLRETARMLYKIYIGMSIIQVVLLILFKMPVYDAFIHMFGSAGTGGFSSRALSVGAYNNLAAEITITVFMFLFGVNFSIYHLLLQRDFKSVWEDEELRAYLGIVLGAIALISINLIGHYATFGEGVRHASFQVSTIITTTGYATTDFNLWPSFSKAILVLLMVFGCSAGSTGGGVKIVRIVTLVKAIKAEINSTIRPRMVKPVTINGKLVTDKALIKIAIFFFIYATLFFTATLLVSLDGQDLVTTATAVVSTMSNIGPGLGDVGPMGHFGIFSGFSKLVLSFCMLAGRLEFLPILILFTPSLWTKKNKVALMEKR